MMMGKMAEGMMAFMYKRMMACDDASYHLSLRQDHRLGLWESMKLRMHLMSCHLCRKYASQIKQLDHLLSRYGERSLSAEPSHHLHPGQAARMKSAVEEGLHSN